MKANIKISISQYLEIDAAALVWLFCDTERGTGERLESREVDISGLAGAEAYNCENQIPSNQCDKVRTGS